MIVSLCHLFKVRIAADESHQLLLAKRQVVELVLEDYARVVKSVGDDGVALSHLLLRERNLRQIILALVRIVLRTICHERQRVGYGFSLRY